MNFNSSIYVAGCTTLIGKAIVVALRKRGYKNSFTDSSEDLKNIDYVETIFRERNPEFVFLAAGKTGGIAANMKYPADLMLDNLLISCNIIECARRNKVKKLLYLASSCSYPRDCIQPMKEDSLLTGLLEPTNEAYAIAKIAGMKLCQAYNKQYGTNFIAAIPANAFGPGDDFSEEDSHVVAALLRRMHEAKENKVETFEVWGTGKPRREFIYIDDLADACLHLMKHYNGRKPINIGTGQALSIGELALIIKDVSGYSGKINFNASKPDGMPIKVLDSRRIAELGWKPSWSLQDALKKTYSWFLDEEQSQTTNHLRM